MTRDIRLSFDRVPEIYDRVRPSYPPSFFEELFSLMPSPAQVLEVGPGTGQATRSLLAQRATVTAVEIGPNLAATLRHNFADEHGLTVVNDAFEEADLPLVHFDAIVCATAYHWIEPEAQVARPIELLAPGGVVAIIDLIQVDSAVDQGYFKRVVPIYEAFGKAQRDWDPKTYDTARPKIANAFEASGRYASVRVARERWDQTYTTAQYRDLLLSYSGTQMMEEPERSSMVDQLVEVVEHEFAGSVTRPLVATLTLATTMQ